MLAINDRLVATVEFNGGLQVVAFRVPARLADDRQFELSIVHLHADAPRQPHLVRRGLPLGMMVQCIRVFRAPRQPGFPKRYSGLPAQVTGAALELAVHELTGLSPTELVCQFENLGHGCHFGLVQRHSGAEPLGLLRFVDATTAHLYKGLIARFDGIEDKSSLEFVETKDARPSFRMNMTRYNFAFNTLRYTDEVTPDIVAEEQSTRLRFLRRKFLEDWGDGEKIFVLTRGECLTEPEALAIFCALNLEAPNTLLWTTYDDIPKAGCIDYLEHGFMQGHLGSVNEHRYATREAWLSVLANAYFSNRIR